MSAAVVLDMSFLHGASPDELRRLFDDHEVLMTAELLFELLDSTPEERRLRTSKFPTLDSPGPLVAEIGHQLFLEDQARKPAVRLPERTFARSYEFNERLRDPEFQLPSEMQQRFEFWQKYNEENAAQFHQAAACVSGWFPDLKGIRGGEAPERTRAHKRTVAEDLEMVREIYGAFAPESAPPPAIVGRSWTHFRRTQVHLVGALHYVHSYGDQKVADVNSDAINRRLDLDYCIQGILTGGIATRDKFIERTFTLLCPDGELIS